VTGNSADYSKWQVDEIAEREKNYWFLMGVYQEGADSGIYF